MGEMMLDAAKQQGYSRQNGFSYRELRRSKDDPNATRQLAAVMSSARKGPGAPEYAQRNGRIDRRRVGRLAYGEGRVFSRPDAAAPRRVLAHILIDASGSMVSGENKPNVEVAAQVGRNLANAIESLPWARGVMAAHTTARIYSVETGAYEHNGPVYVPLWKSGEPTEYVDDVLTIDHAGNEDGFAVGFACEDILSDLKRDEKGLLIVLSDGAPAYGGGEDHVREVVDFYRKKGIRIVSVAIGTDYGIEAQHSMYGSSDVVEYNDNVSAFAQSLARVIGSSI